MQKFNTDLFKSYKTKTKNKLKIIFEELVFMLVNGNIYLYFNNYIFNLLLINKTLKK